jgi:Ran GTPase-activating protein (RanGAP) involved in mRNA processing and transport
MSDPQLNKETRRPSKITDKIVFIGSQLKNEIVNFSGYVIGDEGVKIISDILSSNSNNKKNFKIKEMKIPKSHITDDGFKILIDCVEKYQNITHVYLNKNKITDFSSFILIDLIKNNKNLKYINLSDNLLTNSTKENIRQTIKSTNSSVKIDL